MVAWQPWLQARDSMHNVQKKAAVAMRQRTASNRRQEMGNEVVSMSDAGS